MKDEKGIYDLTGYWVIDSLEANNPSNTAEYLFFSNNNLLQWGYKTANKICVITFNCKIEPQFIKTVLLPNLREESTPYSIASDEKIKLWYSNYETVWTKTNRQTFFTSESKWEPDPELIRPDYMKILNSPPTEYHYRRAKNFNVSPQIVVNTQALWLSWSYSKEPFSSFHFNDFEYILSQGVISNFRSNEKQTLLMNVAGDGYTNATKLLLDYGFEINAKDIHNKTALDYATYYNRIDTFQLLLSRGAVHGGSL